MDQTKLMDAGVFLLKRIKSIIVITLLIALVMVLCNCFLNSSVEETYNLRIASDMTLDTFVSGEATQSTVVIGGETAYPFDDEVAQYVENAKLAKKSEGRLNPYNGQKRFGVESIQTTFLQKEFSEFLKEKGFKGSAGVTINANSVSLNLSYNNKNDITDSQVMAGYVEEYIALVMENYIKDVRDTHEKLIESDKEQINQLLSQYETLASQTNGNALSNEKCRDILSSYAQVAYNHDVSKSVVMHSNQLLELNVGHKVILEGVKTYTNNSVKTVAVFGAFGLVIGLVFACFIVYIASFVKQVIVRAKNQQEPQEPVQ